LYDIWRKAGDEETPDSVLSGFHATMLGELDSCDGLARWDFSSKDGIFPGNPNAFVEAAQVANLPAPTGEDDIDWLQLQRQFGGLADQVYRVDTRGGQPPATCDPEHDTELSEKYISIDCTSHSFDCSNIDGWLQGSMVGPSDATTRLIRLHNHILESSECHVPEMKLPRDIVLDFYVISNFLSSPRPLRLLKRPHSNFKIRAFVRRL
jgi:hypothetical protein